MTEEKKKEEDKVKFEFTKTRIWQVIAGVLVIAVLVLAFYNPLGNNQPNPKSGPAGITEIDMDDDAVLGDPDAPVTIVEFSDFQCPFCGSFFAQTLPLIKKNYMDKGKVKMVYRDFPLSFHPEAQPAAEADECAHEQGKFWEFHDGLFNNQQYLGEVLYMDLAEKHGLDL